MSLPIALGRTASLARRSGAPPGPWTPLNIASLAHLYEGGERETIVSGEVSVWGDGKGSVSLAAPASTRRPEAVAASSVLTGATLLFDPATDDRLDAPNESAMAFFHAAQGATCFGVWHKSSAGVGSVINSHRGLNISGWRGHSLQHDRENNRIIARINNGSGVAQNTVSANGSVGSGAHYFVWRVEESRAPSEFQLRLNGSVLESGNFTNPPTSGDSVRTMMVGLNDGDANSLNGEVGALGWCTDWISDADVSLLEAWLAEYL